VYFIFVSQKEKLYLKVYRRAFKYNFLSIFYRKEY